MTGLLYTPQPNPILQKPVYTTLNDLPAALNEYQEAIRCNDKFADPYSGVARVYGAMGDYDTAEKECKKGLNLFADNAELHEVLGNVYLHRFLDNKQPFELDQAISEFEESLRLDPTTGVWYSLGFAHNSRGDWAAALEAYRKVTSPFLMPKTYLNMGSIYSNMERKEEATRAWEQAAELGDAEVATRARKYLNLYQ